MNYIHYGHENFDPVYMLSTMNPAYKYRRHDKPHGLWASPVDCEFPWKEWCENEDFHTDTLDKSFTFSLFPDARVLHVNHLCDIEPFVRYVHHSIPDPSLSWSYPMLHLNAIYDKYDAMELHMSKHWNELHDFSIFYSWDVDSIVVWNPDVVAVNE